MAPARERLLSRKEETWRPMSLCLCVTGWSSWRFTLNCLSLWLHRDCWYVRITGFLVAWWRNTLLYLLFMRFSTWPLLVSCISCYRMAMFPGNVANHFHNTYLMLFYNPSPDLSGVHSLRSEREMPSFELQDWQGHPHVIHMWSLRGSGHHSTFLLGFDTFLWSLISNSTATLKMLLRSMIYWIIF